MGKSPPSRRNVFCVGKQQPPLCVPTAAYVSPIVTLITLSGNISKCLASLSIIPAADTACKVINE